MKIVLVSPYLFKSISVRMLASAVKEASHSVSTIFFKEIVPNDIKRPTKKEYSLFRDSVEKIKPDLVGISVRSTFFKEAGELTRLIKNVDKDIFVMWGGIHPTVAPEHSLTCADAVCLGEGIYPMIEFIEKYSTGNREGMEQVRGMYIRKNGKIIKNDVRDLENNIDNYPDPDWSEKDALYIEKDTIFKNIPRHVIDNSYYIMSSYGCPFSCFYCCNDALKLLYKGKGRYVRRRSVMRVIEELKRAKILFPDLGVVHIVDDVFTFDKNWLAEFSQRYKDEIGIPFSCYSQPSMIDKEMIGMLMDAGLSSLTMGIQSGSEYIRRSVFNITTYTNEDIKRAAFCLKDLKIVPCYDLLLDNPFEEIRHKYESLDLLLDLSRPFDLHQHSLTFFPGVELTRRAVKEGIIKDEFVECEEQKSIFRWTSELDGRRQPQDLFWDILFFMTRYHGIPKSWIRKFSRTKLFYRKPKLIYPIALIQKSINRFLRHYRLGSYKRMSKKILFITTGTRITASSRTRVYNYKPFLEKSGYDVSIIPYNTAIDAQLNAMAKNRSLAVKLSNRINHFFKCVLYLIIVPCYDVIVLQRVLLPKAVFKLIKSLNKKLIFDFDDAIYMADQKKKSFLNNNKFLKRFEYIVKGCDCIVVSNEALKERTNKLNSNVIRIPTSVDTDKLTPSSRGYNGSLVIGWIGSPEGTRYIKSLKEIFEGLFKKFPFLKMKLVGALPLDDWKIDMAVKGWSPKEEVKDLQSFDIGVMALDNDEWSNAKAGYKLLQYMAVGIPCVASTVGVNKEIVEEGITGFLASTPEEWKEKLSILISDVDLRKRMGIAGRMKAERFYSYKVNAPKLAGIL